MSEPPSGTGPSPGADRPTSESSPDPRTITLLVESAANGDADAADRLFPLVYDELRALAARHMRGERSEHTLQPTALVHEAWIRVLGEIPVGGEARGRFFAAATEAMRRILIDHARRRGAIRRGGDWRRVGVSLESIVADEKFGELLALEAAIVRLEERDPEGARVVRLRFYGGLTVDQTAEVLGLSARSVDRQWAFARSWLLRELARTDDADAGDAPNAPGAPST